jgi:hypothetical protein
MNRRTAVATAGAITLTLLAGSTALAANLGILERRGSDTVGDLSPVSDTFTDDSTTVPSVVDTIIVDDTTPATSDVTAPDATPGATTDVTFDDHGGDDDATDVDDADDAVDDDADDDAVDDDADDDATDDDGDDDATDVTFDDHGDDDD